MSVRSRAHRRDDGMIMPLVLVFTMVALALIIVVADVTAVHIQRGRLYALTDAAALDAADALNSGGFYAQGGLVRTGAAVGGGRPIPLSDASVRQSAVSYLLRAGGPPQLDDLAVGDPTGSPSAGTAQVTLTAQARLPILGFVVSAWSDGIPLTVTAQAQARRP